MNFERGTDPKSSMGIGRGTYSKKEFPGYKIRATIRIVYKEKGQFQETRVDVYTDREDRRQVLKELMGRTKKNGPKRVMSLTVDNWSTALQDRLQAEFIEETLKDL